MSAVVGAKGLSRWYGQVTGVLDLTFEIGEGVTGLLGPNGAGKSTLLALITGQLRPTRGEIVVFSARPWNNRKLMRRIGACSELDAFYENMTGHGFLVSLLRYAGLGRKEASKNAEAAMDLVGLTGAAHRKIGGYSKGMRQRTKVAQALAGDPDLVILDEPLNGMDPVARASTTRLIKEIGRSGKHVIVSSHVLHEVEAMTSQIVLMHQGRLLAQGDIHEIRGLIDEHPHQIEIECKEPRKLAARLMSFEDVISVSLEEDASADSSPGWSVLRVTSLRPDDFYARVTGLVLETQTEVRRLSSADDNLQAVFNYLVR